jgi:hypothetical protein
MTRRRKPIRKCYRCELNLGDRCWRHDDPRAQWAGVATCPDFENEASYLSYRAWLRQPRVKTLQDIRRSTFRTRHKPREHAAKNR